MPPKKKTAGVLHVQASEFGGKVACEFLTTIKPVVEALEPENVYSFWHGFMSAWAAFSTASLPPGQDIQVLEQVLGIARHKSDGKKLN